jgi:hypothetical protein
MRVSMFLKGTRREGVFQLAQDRIQWRDVVNMINVRRLRSSGL